jgi:hypothetical protein
MMKLPLVLAMVLLLHELLLAGQKDTAILKEQQRRTTSRTHTRTNPATMEWHRLPAGILPAG